MENPFFRNYVKSSSRPRFFDTTTARSPRGIPVVRQPTTTTKSPKVVSIPVHFVGSEATRSNAARRIQKVFRGYRVRKNVKRIVGIKKQVDEIEKKISHKETIDLVRNDAKEGLKVNEMLMALLFKLDSVGGFDSGVRECRRAVIKKAIMLQERLDLIVSGDVQTLGGGGSNDDQEDKDSMVEEAVEDQTLGRGCDDEVKEGFQGVEQLQDQPSEEGAAEKVQGEDEIAEKNAAQEESRVEAAECLKESPSGKDRSSVEVAEVKSGERNEEEKDAMEIEEEEETEKKEAEEEETVPCVADAADGGKQLLEKMIEKNEMLIGMVADLCERNTVQSQLLNSLSKRVDNLEKALSKCKKRRKVAPSRKGHLQQ